MRIDFEFVRWKNLLSYGNYWTEIQLNRSSSTLIIGKNGVGKSTFLDALMYLLYGKAARDINKPQMINSINGKGLLVEGQFRIGKRTYFVRRGDVPAIFEIHIDGVLQKPSASRVDDQKNFVKNVLRMTDKSFKQIVILGSANYVPFMQLTAADRRKIIEDLLDIQIFSAMNQLLYKRSQINRAELLEVDTELRILQDRIELSKKHLATLKLNHEELVETREIKIQGCQDEIASCLTRIEANRAEVLAFQEGVKDHDKLNRKLEKLATMEKQLEDRARKLRKDITFFHENENCPTCKQGIQHDFKAEATTVRQARLNEISDALVQLNKSYDEVRLQLNEIGNVHDQIMKLNEVIYDFNTQINFQNKVISELQQEIDQLREKNTKFNSDENELNSHLKDLTKKSKVKERLSKHQAVIEVAGVLLKDSGIKTKIIRQYVPIMNKLINKYLAQMDFFCNFELDENFNERIRSRHRDVFGYNSFSQGQKARIDLALLFTWRQIAKLRNSAGTNLLVMDEVFDGSLDTSGTEELLKIIQDLVGDTHIFVISHKDTLFDKFHSVIEFEMNKNFSQLKVAA